MNNTNDLYNRWLAQPDLDDAVKAELVSIAGDSDAVTDRFYRDLEFGTGGLRGVIGAGTNRMNLYTVRKATQGLADYLNASGLPKKVAIAHDSRHNGELFARETARVLAANGITAYVYPRLEPTPALSWAVRYLGCGAGVCVTASHNPAKYNGYKVYGADGCQITLEAAEKILAAIEKIDCFDDVRLADFDAAAAAGRIVTIDEKCLDDFVQAVYDQRVGDGAGIDALKLVYTPLNGTGLECVKKLLKLAAVGLAAVLTAVSLSACGADRAIVVCTSDASSLRDAQHTVMELRQFGSGRLHLVVNRVRKKMLKALAAAGHYCTVCYGAEEAIRVLQEYINLKKIDAGKREDTMSEQNLMIRKNGKVKCIIFKE